MRRLAWIAWGLLALAVIGCGGSDGDGNGGPEYPDIPGLVVFYRFEGNLENSVADLHHGVPDGTVAYVADHRGTANSALSADGDPVRVADHADLDITGAITLAAWIRPDISDQAFASIVDKDYFTGYSFGMNGGVAADTVNLTAWVSGSWFASDDVVPFATGAWSHVAFTYDEETGEGKFYVNGEYAGGTPHDVAIGVNDVDLHIGVAYHGDTYRGAIDELAIFNRALTAAEVNQLFEFE
jgi:hypothetical protein